MDDPYSYPGSPVLTNKEGIRNADELERFERLVTADRIRAAALQIKDGRLKVSMNAKSYRALHRHIFQDVYDWAGEIRTVEIAKTHMFCRQQFIAPELDKLFAALKAENNLKCLSAEKFAERAAEHMAELNAIHPFREGNGRTQRLFLKALAQQAGHQLLLSRIKQDPWHEASVESFRNSAELMKAVIVSALVDPPIVPNRSEEDGDERRARMQERIENARQQGETRQRDQRRERD